MPYQEKAWMHSEALSRIVKEIRQTHTILSLFIYIFEIKKLQEVKVVVLIIILPVHPFDGCTLVLND